MVNRRIKQIVAIAIALGFAASIIFFIPRVPNATPFTYEILAPTALINHTSPLVGQVPLNFNGENVSSLGGVSYTPIDNIISSTNASNLMQFTGVLLNQSNITYTETNGALDCLNSKQFLSPMCSNSTYSWFLFYSDGQGFSLYNGNGFPSLSSISLKSVVGSNITMLLVYMNPGVGVTTSNSSGAPPLL
jgi:hypothetical protein